MEICYVGVTFLYYRRPAGLQWGTRAGLSTVNLAQVASVGLSTIWLWILAGLLLFQQTALPVLLTSTGVTACTLVPKGKWTWGVALG